MISRHLAVWSLLLFLGCEAEPATNRAAPDRKAETRPDPRFPVVSAQASQLQPLPDNSLTTNEYIRLGLPAPDRHWLGTEFGGIASTIEQLAEEDATKLPRFQSVKSGDVFARLVSHENFEFYRDARYPLPQRLAEALAHMEGLNRVLSRYLTISTQRTGLGGEVIELAGAIMRISVLMRDLSGEMLPQLDPNDYAYPTRMEGYERMKRGFAMTCAGGLQMLAETDRYEITDLQRLLDHLLATLPSMMPHLSEGSQLENLVQIEKLIENPKLKELRLDLRELHARLKSQHQGHRPS